MNVFKNKLIKLVPTFIMITICAGILIYQVNELLTEYLSGQTVASISVGRLPYETLPAFTFCFTESFSIKNLIKFRPHQQDLYEKYQNLAKLLKQIRQASHRKPNYTIEAMYDSAESEYFKMIKLKSVDKNLIDIINQWTIPFDKDHLNFNFSIEGFIYPKENSTTKNFHLVSSMENMLYEPVHSLRLKMRGEFELDVAKCFTFSSALDVQWRNFEVNLEKNQF